MVVPFGPGTTTDIVARQVGDTMAAVLGTTLVVDNKAGAGGTIGSDLVAKSPGDGRTLLMGTVGTHAINATLFRKLSYDPLKDFTPIGLVGYTPTLLVVATLQELGLPDFDLVAWFMVYAPASTAAAEVARLRDAMARALAQPALAAKLGELGIEPRAIAAADLPAFGQAEIKRWGEAVKRSGAQVD